MKRWVLALALLAHPAYGQGFEIARGQNLDIWEEWLTVEDMLARPGFLSPYPDWRRTLPQGRIARLRTDGFDFVRIPFDPSPLLALGPGDDQDRVIADLRGLVDEVLATGLRVVVDLHAIPRPDEVWGVDDITARLWPDHLALVERVGAALHGLPSDRVAFEPLNEPTVDCDAIWGDAAALWPDMLRQMHAAARRGAPDLPLVLSGACWGGIDGLEALDPASLADENILWSFHSYEPFQFTHQSASWTYSALKSLRNLPYPPSRVTDEMAAGLLADALARLPDPMPADTDPQAIAMELANYRATPDHAVADAAQRAGLWADRHDIPRSRLLLGEFGAIHRDAIGPFTGDDHLAFLADKRRAAEAEGIAWAVWSFSGEMATTRPGDPTRALAPGICNALGLSGCRTGTDTSKATSGDP